jgi:hypothetical protein
MNRTLRTILVVLAALAPTAYAAEETDPPKIEQCGGTWGSIFTQSHELKKGVTLLVNGEKLGGLVLGCTRNKAVELKSQEYGRIVVALERIDAAAMP